MKIMTAEDNKRFSVEIFNAALRYVDPYASVAHYLERIRDIFRKGQFRRLIVAGFGKASCPMAKAIEDGLSDLFDSGVVITKYGHCSGHDLKKIRIHEAGHPLPDENGMKGTQEIVNLLRRADEHSIVVCLISGGGSALLVSPQEGITLADKQSVTNLLLKAGADIYELNTVRKHISKVKGGRLAETAFPAKVMSLIISDVMGDRLDVIASGPTSPDGSLYQDALGVIEKFELTGQTPRSVLDMLKSGAEGLTPETPKKESPIFDRVENMIIGNNIGALKAAEARAESFGLAAEIISSDLTGEAAEVGKWLAKKAVEMRNAGRSARSRCLISGGETTVTVKGSGLGGRNMELALAFAMAIEGIDGITLLSAGTDGTDGPTDAAGAIVDGKTVEKARTAGLDPQGYLSNNDSYNFFRKIGGLLITGPTGTNVMDIQIIVIDS